MKMDSTQTAVVGRLVSDAAKSKASKALAAGDHEVDFLFRVQGSFRKGDDFSQEISNKVDHKSLLAAAVDAMRKAGLKVDISELVKASLTDSAKALAKEIAAESQAVMNVIQAPTLTPCNGKITGTKDLRVTVVEREAAEVA